MSLHPPHLVDSSGSLTPAALIPFCAYQTDMTLLGQTRQDLPFTACSHFQPTVLEGQLCYSLEFKINTTMSMTGKRNGLMIFLDQGLTEEGKPTAEDSLTMKNVKELVSLDTEAIGQDTNDARIYLNTLSSFTDVRSGSYAMTSLKKMTGTDSFLELPLDKKLCQIGTFEDCQVQNYAMEVLEQCGCVPWALSRALMLEATIFLVSKILLQFFFQDVSYCSPASSACAREVSSSLHGCSVSCTGLYADIEFAEDKILNIETHFGKGRSEQNTY